MARAWKSIAAVLLLTMATLPLGVSADNTSALSGGIEASVNTVSLVPSSLNAGDSVTIHLTLYNNQQTDAWDVNYAFYKDTLTSSNRLLQDTVDIAGQSTVDVSATWPALTEGSHKVWIEIDNGGSPDEFYVEFDVAGLPNLRVIDTQTSPSDGIFGGDEITVSALVKNIGTVSAVASNLKVDFPHVDDQYLNTPSLNASEEVWVSTTINAPGSGTHSILFTPDFYDEVLEASESNKLVEHELVVQTRMDVYHLGELSVTVEEGQLEGPWTISGTLAMSNGTGQVTVPVILEIPTDSGAISFSPFDVVLDGQGYAENDWTYTLNSGDLSSLPDGDHIITAVIDPYSSGGFIQESTDNDRQSSMLTKYPIPDVFVDGIAIPSSTSVSSGDKVTWQVSVTNTGDIEVKGKLHYTWEGMQDTSPNIILAAGQEITWDVELFTLSGAHSAEFVAQWVPGTGSYDENPLNSKAEGSILVVAPLRLHRTLSSVVLLDDSGENAVLPLNHGDTYTLGVQLTSEETGEVSFDCQDGDGKILSTTEVDISEVGEFASLSCDFTATADLSIVRFVPSDSSVTSTFTRSFSTLRVGDGITGTGEESDFGMMMILGVVLVVLLAIIVVAFILTREREEEVERDIFDYCPACDGELEGDEDRCPHCSFNLKKARKQFHDCHECQESIPDLLEDCPYCGAAQDVASFFERRERRVSEPSAKVEVALPDEEEDMDEHVSGDENFAQTVKEFGYNEDQLEDEWDTNIATAEAEVEAAWDRRHADEIAIEDLTEEEIEELKLQVTPTLKTAAESAKDGGIDSILKDKGDLRTVEQYDGELSASDAHIRKDLYELTGEEGVLPGEKVHVGMSLTDSSIAGNEIGETTSDFSILDDDDAPLSASTKSDEELKAEAAAAKPTRRRGARRRAEPKPQMAECGACSAEIPVDATECSTCGAKFE